LARSAAAAAAAAVVACLLLLLLLIRKWHHVECVALAQAERQLPIKLCQAAHSCTSSNNYSIQLPTNTTAAAVAAAFKHLLQLC
jgi:hypothetical protein